MQIIYAVKVCSIDNTDKSKIENTYQVPVYLRLASALVYEQTWIESLHLGLAATLG